MSIINVDPELVKDNPYQPRNYYNPKKVDEVAYSIMTNGIIHIPKARSVNSHFELVEGHIRKRAYIKLKKKYPNKFPTMPIDVGEYADEQMAVIALEENLRRQDITPLEQAKAIDNYLINFPAEKETALAKKLNMTQGNISNMRRVVQKCPEEVIEKIVDGKINFTMARELLIFEGKSGQGEEQTYSRKERRYINKKRDDKFLMLAAIKETGGNSYYALPATVDGIKKSIFRVARRFFNRLYKEGGYYSSSQEPLFDIQAADCMKCKDMMRAHETKSQTRPFCTNPTCWEKNQKAHMEKQAKAAKKKMEADIAQRIVAAEQERTEDEIMERYTVDDVLDEEETDEDDFYGADIDEEDQFKLPDGAKPFETHEEVCSLCINKKSCRGGTVYAVEGGYYCNSRVTKETFSQQKEKALVNMPESFKKAVTEQSGTRAEVLDLRELRLGYGELKTGFARLDEQATKIIKDPEECLERCTTGFHYAYDSSRTDGHINYVCSNPKCLSQKKAAFTREKNAEGNALKRAELAAIKRAVQETAMPLDRPRIKTVIAALVASSKYGDDSPRGILEKKLKIEHHFSDSENLKSILDAVDKLEDDEMVQLLVECCLNCFLWTGEATHYKAQTTELLNWMGIGINVNKPEKKKEKVTA